MAQGLGSAPFGSSPFGYGAVTAINSTATKLYLDNQGTRRNVESINTVTGDTVRGERGIHKGMDSVAQQVYLAIRTLRGSSVVNDLGINFRVKVISDTITQKVTDAVTEAMSDLVSRQLVSVESVAVNKIKLTAIEVIVTWKNLTNGETETTRWTNG